MIVSNNPKVETLAIYSLGGVAIELRHPPNAGAPATNPSHRRLHFRTRTMEALLIYLASQGRPLGREILAELLWPERTQEQARTNLRVAIHRLREQIDPYLLVTRQSVAINPDSEIFLDTEQFEAHLSAGQLMAATVLYRGDFLDGFYLDGSPIFEQWALLERERLRNLVIAAYQQLIDQTASAGEGDAAIAYAQRLLSLDSLHEPTHRQLMRLLAQAGQRSAALGQYESCRHLLISELGVAPDEMTTALYQQIRHGEDIVVAEQAGRRAGTASMNDVASDLLDIIDDFSPARPVALLLHNLPLQPTPLIGRAAELAQIESLLANPDCRFLTLLGVGGIGKTRLAIAAAQRIADSATANDQMLPIPKPAFADGICFVPLASVGRAELVTVTIAQALGLQTASGDLEAEIVAYLRPRELLLVIDNFEHLVEAANTVAHLLQNAPRLKVLITSRERLYLREEWLLPVSGLSLAEGIAGEAGQLFLHSVQRVQPNFTASGQEDAIAAVCGQVEGMPLALELAASWVRVMPCIEIARQIANNWAFLTTSLRNLPERHRSLRNLFDQSWRLLSPLEQGILMRLSIFAGGWLLEEAASVTGATLAVLLELVDKSLVRVNGQNRFDLHELVRQYAAEQLVASGEYDLIRQRHYVAYLQLFRTSDSHLRGPESAIWFARSEAEQDNLRSALQWVLDKARYEDAAWLMLAAQFFWHFRGHLVEGARWLAQLLPHRHMLTTDLRLAIFVAFYYVAAPLEEFPPLSRYADEVAQLLEGCAYKILSAAGAWWRVVAGTISEADAGEQAVVLARAASEGPRLGSEFGPFADQDFMLSATLWTYANMLIVQGDLTRAVPFAAESLRLFQARGSYSGIGDGIGTLGLLALLQGDLAQAHSRFSEVVALATAHSSRVMLAEWQPLLGIVTLYRGDAVKSRQLLRESLRLSLDLKDKFALSRISAYLAEVALWEGELDQAEQWLDQSLASHAGPQLITIYQVERLFTAARLATAQQRYQRAAMLFGLAGQSSSQIHYELVGPLRALVDTALVMVRTELDSEIFDESFIIGQQLSLAEAFSTILAPSHIGGGLLDTDLKP